MRFIIAFLLLTASLFGQHATVPDSWKSGPPNFGPYVQAPANCGGKWYYVSPFNQQPWLKLCSDFVDPKQRQLPAGFVEVFGPEPVKRADESTFAFIPRLDRWLQDLRYFQSAGVPSEFDSVIVDQSRANYSDWSISEPKFYVGRYGPMVRFAAEDMQFGAYEVVFFPHYVISYIQAKQIQEGVMPARVHPFVPEHLYKEKE